jgi:hypothetical protein
MKTYRNRKLKPHSWDQALIGPLPSGKASNFNQLEAMRKTIFEFLSCMTTDPYVDNSGWTENEIQRAADRLKKIRVRRARAMQDARAKGWRFVYPKSDADASSSQRVYS